MSKFVLQTSDRKVVKQRISLIKGTGTFLQIIQKHYQGFVTGATEVIYTNSGQLPSDALQQITA